MRTVLTIAGSDSCGGAGIQADLRTFGALRVSGASAITAVTAQAPDRIAGIHAIPAEMVVLQVKSVCETCWVSAAKTGMLYSADIVRAVAVELRKRRIPNLVVDPVMISTSGTRLLREDAIAPLRSELLPLATVMTPNIPEARELSGMDIRTVDDMMAAAVKLWKQFGAACVVKGGHLDMALACGEKKGGRRGRARSGSGRARGATDVLCAGGRVRLFSGVRIVGRKGMHGTGCVFSAALAAILARGEPIEKAVRLAKNYVARQIAR